MMGIRALLVALAAVMLCRPVAGGMWGSIWGYVSDSDSLMGANSED
jgi:hypothetical protein